MELFTELLEVVVEGDAGKCVSEKGYDTCADCAGIDACEVVAQVFKNAPEARGNLKTERMATELYKALGVLGIPWLSMLYF